MENAFLVDALGNVDSELQAVTTESAAWLRAIDRSTAVVTEDRGRSLLSADSVEVDGIDVHRHGGRCVEVSATGVVGVYVFRFVLGLGLPGSQERCGRGRCFILLLVLRVSVPLVCHQLRKVPLSVTSRHFLSISSARTFGPFLPPNLKVSFEESMRPRHRKYTTLDVILQRDDLIFSMAI